jgi:hypothetical protein
MPSTANVRPTPALGLSNRYEYVHITTMDNTLNYGIAVVIFAGAAAIGPAFLVW